MLSPGANASVQRSRFVEICNQKPVLLTIQLEVAFYTVLEACFPSCVLLLIISASSVSPPEVTHHRYQILTGTRATSMYQS
jgi:hypothetical protein